jgi:hypothetical protein
MHLFQTLNLRRLAGPEFPRQIPLLLLIVMTWSEVARACGQHIAIIDSDSAKEYIVDVIYGYNKV